MAAIERAAITEHVEGKEVPFRLQLAVFSMLVLAMMSRECPVALTIVVSVTTIILGRSFSIADALTSGLLRVV